MAVAPKLVVITRPTPLEELIARFNTRDQAKFYIEHMGGSFEPYQSAHDAYHTAIAQIKAALPRSQRTQWVDRGFLANFVFGDDDLVMTIGQDGLVVNVAKYLRAQPVIAVNPDPKRIDGVLLPFSVETARAGLERVLDGDPPCHEVTMAEARLNDGQSIAAVNDLFIGPKTHVSARYRLRFGDQEEEQSSSGILVSTGAGSTGWLRSVYTGAAGVAQAVGIGAAGKLRDKYRFDWEARKLVFSVREPFVSRTSGASLVFGTVEAGQPLVVESKMPQNGVIFGDGVEEDYLEFNSGAIAVVGVSERTLRLVKSEQESRKAGRRRSRRED